MTKRMVHLDPLLLVTCPTAGHCIAQALEVLQYRMHKIQGKELAQLWHTACSRAVNPYIITAMEQMLGWNHSSDSNGRHTSHQNTGTHLSSLN
jgi:hypothetical protein